MSEQYRSYADRDPFGFYEELRTAGSVVWDDSVRAWLVLNFDDTSFVLRREDLFARADKDLEGGKAMRDNTRSLAVITGAEHDKLHRYLMRFMDKKSSDGHRSTLIRPQVTALLDRLPDGRPIDLASEVSDQLPVRVGLTLLGIDTTDAAFVESARLAKVATSSWHESMGEDPKATAAAVGANATLRDVFMQVVRERRESPKDDLISELWRTGDTVFSDWGEQDVYSACLTIFGGGETPYALRNMLYALLARPDLQRSLRADQSLVARFVEEVLRALGVIHWQIRVAVADVELAGVTIRKGDRVFPMLASANRDPARYSRAADIELAEKRKAHLAFGQGPRYCIGAESARAICAELVQGMLQTFRTLQLDEKGEPPRYVNFHVRSFRPLFADCRR